LYLKRLQRNQVPMQSPALAFSSSIPFSRSAQPPHRRAARARVLDRTSRRCPSRP